MENQANQDSESLLQHELFNPSNAQTRTGVYSPAQTHDKFELMEEGQSNLTQTASALEIRMKYYEEYKKIYQTSYKLMAEVRKQFAMRGLLLGRVAGIETQVANLHRNKRVIEELDEQEVEEQDYEGCSGRKKGSNKRMRRTAEEIERKYYCLEEYCDRCYGSQGSLQQHIKLKHPAIYKREGYGELSD